jgi:hypothetical protein
LLDSDDTPVEIVEDTGDVIRVHWPVLAVEGLDTGDGRYLVPGGGTHRALPLPLLSLPYKFHGGDQAPAAEVFGQLTTLQLHPGPEVVSKRTGEPFPEGTAVWSADGEIDGTHPHAAMVRKGYLRGGSIDIGELDAELVDDETAAMSDNPRRRAILHTYEIAGATMVPVPAFADAYCDLVDQPDAPAALAASAMPAEMLTDPQPMFRATELGDPVVAAVSAKQRSKAKEDGDTYPGTDKFPISTRQQAENAVQLNGSSDIPAEKVKAWLKRRLKAKGWEDLIPDSWSFDEEALTAAAVARRPPVGWFTNPGLSGETPITIEEVEHDGHTYHRVFGHIAVWSRPHIGYNGKRIFVRPSRSDYAFFNTGAVRAIDPDGNTRIVAVGHLTMDTGHADLLAPAMAASRHYDHTGFAWADVAAGDDKYGVWVNGICKPGITDDQISFAYAHSPSGDWRPIDGGLELVAALCVNTPGIPVSRARVASGQVMALVAAGALAPRDAPPAAGPVVFDYDTLADALADRLLAKQQRVAELTTQRDALLAELDKDNDKAMAELLAQLPDDDTDGDGAGIEELLALGLTREQVAAFDIGRMPPQLRESYLHGKASTKIGWGSDGDFNRCVLEARHHGIPARMRKGMCATLHKEATGKVPGKH